MTALAKFLVGREITVSKRNSADEAVNVTDSTRT
jgi:hypothetical protein